MHDEVVEAERVTVGERVGGTVSVGVAVRVAVEEGVGSTESRSAHRPMRPDAPDGGGGNKDSPAEKSPQGSPLRRGGQNQQIALGNYFFLPTPWKLSPSRAESLSSLLALLKILLSSKKMPLQTGPL